MIIGRSPLRITLGGGSTDLTSYYDQFGGMCISAAINQYVYVAINKTFQDYTLLKYSQLEKVYDINQIKHPIIRESLKLLNINDINLEITSMADIPSGTGLGSSGSFTTCLLKCLQKHKKQHVAPQELAELACHIAIDILGEPSGKQDEYISAYGGINVFQFEKNNWVKVVPLNIKDIYLNDLQNNLIMFSTGFYHSTNEMLSDQNNKTKQLDNEMINNLHYVKELGYKSLDALESGNLIELAEIMNTHWEHKKKRSNKMSNTNIDKWYYTALENGAIGGEINW